MNRTAAVSVAALMGIVPATALGGSGDRNDDGIPDRWERHHRLSLDVDQSRRDQDRDRLRNRAEFRAGTDPRDRDTDDDGVRDDDELIGRITAFDAPTGALTVRLFNGDVVTGRVVQGTEIKCELEDDDRARGSDSGPSSNSGPGSGGSDDSDREDNSGPGSLNSGPGSNDDGGADDRRDGRRDVPCGTEALANGALVEEAELEATAAGLVFEEIEIVRLPAPGA